MMAMTPLISEQDRIVLERAFQRLEDPSYAIRLSSALSSPITASLKLLPPDFSLKIQHCAHRMISLGLDISINRLLANKTPPNPRNHRAVCIATGALGGFLGGIAVWLELPISTALLLSAIAHIAREEGEDLDDLETRLACLSVFAMGGWSTNDDDADLGYFGLRLALQSPINEATRHLATFGLQGATKTPALIHFASLVSQRFGMALSNRTVGMMLPVIGATTGAFCNRMFMDHFQDMARCHFVIRRLERKYSSQAVEMLYLESRSKKESALPHLWADTPFELPRLAA